MSFSAMTDLSVFHITSSTHCVGFHCHYNIITVGPRIFLREGPGGGGDPEAIYDLKTVLWKSCKNLPTKTELGCRENQNLTDKVSKTGSVHIT